MTVPPLADGINKRAVHFLRKLRRWDFKLPSWPNWFHTWLRSVGLHILSTVIVKTEEPKSLVDSSRKLAVARCTIHIIPSVVSIFLIMIQIRGRFIGSDLQGLLGSDETKLGFIQMAAKIQELLIISSIGSIIFHAVRSELVFGDGLPIGLVVSGWTFSQISYFWSTDLWGGARSSGFSFQRSPALLLLILLGGLIAVLAGPASAVLMLPVRTDWHVGGGRSWLNGSDAELWPSTLDESFYAGENCTGDLRKFSEVSVCPSGGTLPLHNFFTTFPEAVRPLDVVVHDFRITKTLHSRPGAQADIDTWAYTAHQASVSVQDAMRDMHSSALRWLAQHHPFREPYPTYLLWAESVTLAMKNKVPAVRTYCREQTEAFVPSNGSRDIMISFPRLEEYSTGQSQGPITLPPFSKINMTDRLPRYLFDRGFTNRTELPLNKSEIFADARRVLIIPHDIWNHSASSLGLLVLLDGNGDSAKPAEFNAMACSIDARWMKATTIVTAPTQRPPLHVFEQAKSRVPVRVVPDSETMRQLGTVILPFNPPRDGSLSPIRLRESWYNLLSPTVPDGILDEGLFRGGKNQSMLERIMDVMYFEDGIEYTGYQRRRFQATISLVFADGISRAGSFRHKGTTWLRDPVLPVLAGGIYNFTETQARALVRKGNAEFMTEKPEILHPFSTTEVTMKAYYTGYVLSASTSWFNWFSIATLSLHAVLALYNSIWVIAFRPRTSNAWDTITDLLYLAHRSESPAEPTLKNTSAGTRSFSTPALIAWTEVMKQGSGSGEKRLRMVLRESGRSKDSEKPEQDTKYD